jgi:hypothetical protein
MRIVEEYPGQQDNVDAHQKCTHQQSQHGKHEWEKQTAGKWKETDHEMTSNKSK